MTAPRSDRTPISLLWAFVALNIAYADILSIHVPGILPQVLEGEVDGVRLSAELMLIGSVFLQIPLVMMVLAQVLSPWAGRLAHGAAAVATGTFIIGGGSMLPHYLFIAACEIGALALIVRLAWRGRERRNGIAGGDEDANEKEAALGDDFYAVRVDRRAPRSSGG